MEDNTNDSTTKPKNAATVTYYQVEKETIMIDIVFDMLFEMLEQNIKTTD